MSLRRIDLALKRRMAAVLANLITRAGNQHDPTQYELLRACRDRDVKETQRLLGWRLLNHTRLNPAANDSEMLRWAVEYGHRRICNLLLADRRSNPTAGNISAFDLAAINGQLSIVDRMLDDEKCTYANVDFMVAMNGHSDIVRLILDKGQPDPSVDDNWMFLWAVKYGHHDIVETLLIDGRADPTAVEYDDDDDDECTNALNYAMRLDDDGKMVQLLLADGRTDPTSVDDHRSIIGWVAEYGDTETMKLLLADERVDPTVEDGYAYTWAVRRGDDEMVQLLLEDGRVNHKYRVRMLWIAAKDGRTPVVRLLLDYKDPILQSCSCSGLSKLIAKSNKYPEIRAMLQGEFAKST